MSKVQEILGDVEKQRQEILQKCDDIYIVNAGRMNHGKSSLFNALLGHKVYKVADIHQTTENQKELYKDHIYFIDTPGLDVNMEDDEVAYSVYKQANFIIYVHNPRIGELHKKELDHIKRLADILTPEYFRSHFAMVMTFSEEFLGRNKDKLDEILVPVRASLQDILGGEVQIFCISNKLYDQACNVSDSRKQKVFLENSGILALREFIDEHLPIWQQENVALQKKHFANLREDALIQLEELRKQAEDEQKRHQEKFKEQKQRVKDGFANATARIQQYTTRFNKEKNAVNNLKKSLSTLREKHKREYY